LSFAARSSSGGGTFLDDSASSIRHVLVRARNLQMDTTVIGLFSDRPRAAMATARLLDAGFPDEQIRIVDADSPCRREFFGERADVRRGIVAGVVVGVGAGLLAGTALVSVFSLLVAVLGGLLVGACWGVVLGVLVSRAMATSGQAELEQHVERGGVLVAVSTDAGHAPRAKEALAAEGGTSMVTAASPVADRGIPDRRVPSRALPAPHVLAADHA
jgi:hypothetical protein